MRFLCDPTRRCFLDSRGQTLTPKETRALKDYQRRYLPQTLLKVMENEDLSPETRGYEVFKWMYRLTQSILTGYQQCQVPFGGKSVMEPYKTKINLLSEDGENLLFYLNEFERALSRHQSIPEIEKDWKEIFDYPLMYCLLGATAPAHLNLNFFRDYTPIFEKIRTLNATLYKNGYVTMSISSGCMNGCPHCGAEATGTYGIISLPFPLVKEIREVRGDEDWRCYNASDPLDYYDPIFQGSFLEAPFTITKGYRPYLLKDKENPRFLTEQRRYDALQAYRDFEGDIVLSCIDFGPEMFENPRNWQRLYANINLLKGRRYHVQFLGQGTESVKFFKDHVRVPIRDEDEESFGEVDAVGRAAGSCYQDIVTRNDRYDLDKHEILLEADGSVYACYSVKIPSGRRIVWRFIGNLFQDEAHLWEQLEYIETHPKFLKNKRRFPLVEPAYKHPDLENKPITIKMLPALPKGRLVARQFPDIPVIEDSKGLALRPPMLWKEYLRNTENFPIKEGSMYYTEVRGSVQNPSHFFAYLRESDLKKSEGMYGLTGDITDTVQINTPKKKVFIANVLFPTRHSEQYRLKMPDIRILKAEHVGLSGLELTHLLCPEAHIIEVQNCQLKQLSSAHVRENCLFVIANSELSADCLCSGTEIENVLLDDNTYIDKVIKLPAGCQAVAITGHTGPDCLDLSACSKLKYLDFSFPQKGKVILPPTLSPDLEKIIQRYYPNPNQIEFAGDTKRKPIARGTNAFKGKQVKRQAD